MPSSAALWGEVEAALSQRDQAATEGKAELHEPSPPLVLVLFAHAWDPGSLHAAGLVRDLGERGRATCFVVEGEDGPEAAARTEHGVRVSPTIVLFWRGAPMRVRRPGWADDAKVVGAVERGRLDDLVRAAERAGESGAAVVEYDF